MTDAIGVDEHDRGAQENAERDRDQDRGEDWVAGHRPHEEPIDEKAGQGREERRRDDRQRGLPRHRGGHQEQEVAAERHHVALGQIQDARRPVDEHVTRGQQRVEARDHDGRGENLRHRVT